MAISISTDCVIVNRVKVHNFKELQDLIGGYVTIDGTVEYKGNIYTLIVDEEGEPKNLKLNELMFNKFDKLVYGPALLLSGRETKILG